MSNLEYVWYSLVALCCLLALSDWRRGVYAGLLVDVLRDPVRKLVPGQSVAVTLSGALLWFIIVSMVAITRRDQLALLYRRYPKLRTAMTLLLLALLPAAMISVVSYPRGWILALLGGISYLIPTLGVLAGFVFVRKEADLTRFMLWYVVINAFVLVSVPFEYYELPVPALSGIEHDWIRHRTGYVVQLICGWYRSPDVMGLHAAHVIMFCVLLAMRPSCKARPVWISFVFWAGYCIVLSGRRKMVAIPLVFLATVLLLGVIYRVPRLRRMIGLAGFCGFLGAAVVVFLSGTDTSSDHIEYAGSLFTEGIQRGNDIIVGSTMGTLQSIGLIGAGLGTATQGRYHAGVQLSGVLKGWQEDGVSRMFMEFGVPGVILLICAFALLLKSLGRAMRSLPRGSNEILLQLGLMAVIVGDAASFAISHQQFSGDPVNALVVTLLIGMVLRMPGILRLGTYCEPNLTVSPHPGLVQVAHRTKIPVAADDAQC